LDCLSEGFGIGIGCQACDALELDGESSCSTS
jgi:hypothetical protein